MRLIRADEAHDRADPLDAALVHPQTLLRAGYSVAEPIPQKAATLREESRW
jgi:hypothetical protein